MYLRRGYLFILVLFSSWAFLSCRANSWIGGASRHEADSAKVNDGSAIVSETMGPFRTQTYSATVNITKIYKNGLRYDDVLRFYSKSDQRDHIRLLMLIKPQAERKGAGLLIEMQNNELLSGYRFIPESKTVVPVNSKKRFVDVVVGGLSLQDFQLMQGLTPFAEMRIHGREEIEGRLCDVIEVIPFDNSQYHHARLFTTVAERLPVVVRAFSQDGAVIKEIVFDKLEQVGQNWVVIQLTVIEKKFNYTSTFKFENVQVNPRIDDSVFTPDFLQKGYS
jgi:hypothetical protein